VALPPGVVVALGELALSPKVQEFATNLVKDVYGKVMPSKKTEEAADSSKTEPATLESLAMKIEDLPTRQELIASFAVLQAELERQHTASHRWLRAVVALQLAILVGLAGLLI